MISPATFATQIPGSQQPSRRQGAHWFADERETAAGTIANAPRAKGNACNAAWPHCSAFGTLHQFAASAVNKGCGDMQVL